ncbi:MAG: DUF1007 family protein [Rhizobiales bacterium]|nr:DUF1007 family protein [Hyphomicrobiales bacterium]
MRNRLLVLIAAAAGSCLMATAAVAHPHVWVMMQSELAYAPDGSVTGVRHAWTFDDMFSTFATQGLPQKTKGVFTREELAPLAEVNMTSLKEFEYFNYGKADGKKASFAAPKDYWLDYKDNTLILHFTLPLQAPVKAKSFSVEVYDPSYYVDFAFTQKDPVALAGAPTACKLMVAKPQEMTVAQGQRLGEAFFNNLNSSENWGAQFANRVTVTCP